MTDFDFIGATSTGLRILTNMYYKLYVYEWKKNPGKRVAEIRWQDGKYTH